VTEGSRQPRRKGRPRSHDVDAALISAALAEFTEHGFHQMRMESIASRAGVSKVSLYRRWASKRAVAEDVLRLLSQTRPLADHGSLKADVQALVTESIGSAAARANATIVMRTMGEISSDPDLLALYRTHLLTPRLGQLRTVAGRARDRGELREDIHTDVACAAIAGPIFIYHLALLTDAGRLPDDPAAITDAILAGIARRPDHVTSRTSREPG